MADLTKKDYCNQDDLISLKVYFDQALELRDRALEDYKKSLEGNQILSDKVMDRRLSELNELRRQVLEDRGLYLRLDVYDSKHQLLEGRISTIEKFDAKIEGLSKGSSKSWGNVALIITLGIAVLSLLLNAARLANLGL